MKKIILFLAASCFMVSFSFSKDCSYSVSDIVEPYIQLGRGCQEVKGGKFDNSIQKISNVTDYIEVCKNLALEAACDSSVTYEYKCLVDGGEGFDSWSKESQEASIKKIVVYLGGIHGIGAEKIVASCK